MKRNIAAEPKLTEKRVFELCNSMNAWQPPLRRCNFVLAANYMLQAQGVITSLWEENKRLRKMIESKELQDSE